MENYYNNNSNRNRTNSNSNRTNGNRRRRNSNDINFRGMNYSQRSILDLYVNMYNNTTRQIDLLNANLNEIRHTIDYLVENINDELYHDDLPRPESNISRERMNSYYRSNPNVNNNNNNNNNNLIRQSNIISENLNDIFSLLQSYNNLTSQSNSDIITNTTRLITYSEIENPLNDRCPILHEIFQENEEVRQIIPCGHIFSNNELIRWLERNLHCPVCRFNLREVTLRVSNENEAIPNNASSNDASANEATVNDENANNANTLENALNRIRYDIRYDISGNYLLFETYHRI